MAEPGSPINCSRDEPVRTACAFHKGAAALSALSIDESFRMGGEATLAPGYSFGLNAEPDNAGPMWLAN